MVQCKVQWVYSMGRMSILNGQSEVYGQNKCMGRVSVWVDWTDWVEYVY